MKGKIRGVILVFHGLNHAGEKRFPDVSELEFAAHGGLCVFPYYGPWSWMNAGSVILVNEIIRRVYGEYKLANDIPLIITGGSMGGHAALNFALHSKKTPAAVACNCPVTDPKFHRTERPDLPRTFLLAYGMEGRPIDEVFDENSPLVQAKNMPRTPYLIVHGTNDKSVNKAAHSDKFVRTMREEGHDIEYIEAEGMEHCTFTDFAVYRKYMDFVLRFISA
ncbi:MAG: prolyl oligopeptidase family serine peptidase [Treponema sp.]|nr:prolyl oligopeptidase family serine peptidase [Treponema sp.]